MKKGQKHGAKGFCLGREYFLPYLIAQLTHLEMSDEPQERG